jgi:pimeloyl-ACP methyl ester carboxylesterase
MPVTSAPGDLRGDAHLTIFVHGFNNSVGDADAAWADTEALLLSMGASHLPQGLAHFYWPGDERWKPASKLLYSTKVKVARACGEDLGDYLTKLFDDGRLSSVQLVGHSLGCRVVLETARRLQESGRKPDDVLLMAAAVPAGLCEDGRIYSAETARIQIVLYSWFDNTLRKIFPAGQVGARLLGDDDPGPRKQAVGYTGEPWYSRWNESVPMNLTHGQYWKVETSVRHIGRLLGVAMERRVHEWPVYSREIDEFGVD